VRLLGRLKYYLAFAARRRAIRWTEASLPKSTPRIECRRTAREHVVNSVLRDFVSDLMMIQDAKKYASLITIEGWHHVPRSLELGKGVVLLTTKVGIPRVLRWYLRTQDCRVCYLLRMGLAYVVNNSLRARFGRWHRRRYHLDDDELFGQEELSVQYMKKAYDHLRRNGLVNIAGDGQSGDRRVPVRICGREMTFAVGGLSLGLMSGAVILPCFTTLDSSLRFRIQFQAPLQYPEGELRSQQLESLASDYALRIEEYIQLHPTNVFKPRYLSLAESHGR
jgi:lauroyl/myristoyl acyltransferase